MQTIDHFASCLYEEATDASLRLLGCYNQLVRRYFTWASVRLAIIGFCIGLNVILGAFFLIQARWPLPQPVARLLLVLGFLDSEAALSSVVQPPRNEPDLTASAFLDQLNQERESAGLGALKSHEVLDRAAEVIRQELANHEYDQEKVQVSETLEEELERSRYVYEWVSQHTLIGPFFTKAAVTALLDSDEQRQAALEGEFSEVGIAALVVDDPNLGQVGVVVLLLAKPAPIRSVPAETISISSPKPPTFPPISDYEVFSALNSYRQSHGIHQLVQHEALCNYAQKRVGDLLANGGLDGHAGFKKDFEDPANPPEALKSYSGHRIGENLAYQYCRNMQTSDSFIAQTGVALIEWCFDSSTKGHREAQLDARYNNVCVRHDKGYYVVIFGE